MIKPDRMRERCTARAISVIRGLMAQPMAGVMPLGQTVAMEMRVAVEGGVVVTRCCFRS